MTTLETPRTRLHMLQPEDAPRLRDYLLENQAHLSPWEPARAPDYFTGPAISERLQQHAEAGLAGTAKHFAATDPVSGRIVALCSFTNIVLGAFKACHLGYSVSASMQGTGLMQEVVQAAIRHMFDDVGLHRIMANHSPRNVRSAALLARLGFEREGFARAYLHINGTWEDMVLNSLINPGD